MIKTNGAEFKRFYNDDAFWSDGSYYENCEIFVDGVNQDDDHDLSKIYDSSKVIISGGEVFLNGKDDPIDFEYFFKKWQKKQKITCIAVEIPKENLEQLKNFLKSIGGKILT